MMLLFLFENGPTPKVSVRLHTGGSQPSRVAELFEFSGVRSVQALPVMEL